MNDPVHQETAGQRDHDRQSGAAELRQRGDLAQPSQRLQPQNTRRDTAQRPAQAMQRPDSQDVIDLPAVLSQGEHVNEQGARAQPQHQGPARMHHIRTRAHRHQTRQGAVVDEARVIASRQQSRQGAADHGHEGVHGDQSADGVHGLRGHDIEAEPAHGQYPGPQRQKRDARRRMRGDAPVAVVATAPRPHQNHGRQCDPAAQGMDHHGPREIVKRRAELALQPCLQAKIAIPGDSLEQRIDETDQQKCRGKLRIEASPLRDAAGNDGGYGRRERQQEKELDQGIAMILDEMTRALIKMHAIGQIVADEEIGDGRYGEIDENFHQGIDLILAANRAQFQKRESGMHGQHHDGAEQDKQDIRTIIHIFHGWPRESDATNKQK